MENNEDNKEEKTEETEEETTETAAEESSEPSVKLSKSGKFTVPGAGLGLKYGGANRAGRNSGFGARPTKRTGPRGDK